VIRREEKCRAPHRERGATGDGLAPRAADQPQQAALQLPWMRTNRPSQPPRAPAVLAARLV